MDYLVVTLFNRKSNLSVYVYQKSRTEYKIKLQVGHTSYSIDYVWGKYELARTCFCYMINGYNLVTNNLGLEFAHAIHAGDFSKLEEPTEEPPLIQPRGTPFRTAYERNQEEPIEEPPLIQPRGTPMRTAYEEEPLTRTENVILEPIEEPSILTRTENVILEPEKVCPWKLAD